VNTEQIEDIFKRIERIEIMVDDVLKTLIRHSVNVHGNNHGKRERSPEKGAKILTYSLFSPPVKVFIKKY